MSLLRSAGRKPCSKAYCEVCGQVAKYYLEREAFRWFCYEHFMVIKGDDEWFDLTVLTMRAEYAHPR